MEKIKQLWNSFAEKNPKAAQWVREGGLFFLVSNGITLVRGFVVLLLTEILVPMIGKESFGFPGIPVNIFGIEFDWYILGYDSNAGGVSYFTAFIIGTVIFEIVNFFIQRSWVFRSKGNIVRQFILYFLAFCIVIPIVNSINCFWVAFMTIEWIEAIGTTVLTGGVAMVVFFFLNKVIFIDTPKQNTENNENGEA